MLFVETRKDFNFTLNYVKKPKMKILKESFKASDFAEKGIKAQGVRVVAKEVQSVVVEKK